MCMHLLMYYSIALASLNTVYLYVFISLVFWIYGGEELPIVSI